MDVSDFLMETYPDSSNELQQSVEKSFERQYGNQVSSETDGDNSDSGGNSPFTYFPNKYFKNFTDLGNLMVMGSSENLTWWERIKRAFMSLAHLTKTKPECYEAAPANMSDDISGVI